MNIIDEIGKIRTWLAELNRLLMGICRAGGEANTASNQGAGGVGLYNGKVAADLQFRNINAASNKITVVHDAPNKEVDIDVDPSKIDLGDLGDVDNAAPNDNDVLTWDAAGATWQPEVGGGGGGVVESDIQFYDEFDDASIYWAWRDDAHNGTIVEAGSVVTLSLAAAADGRGVRPGKDYNPRIFTGCIGYPMIAECKLNSYSVNDGTSAGLYVSMSPGYKHWDWYLIARERNDGVGYNGLCVWANGANKATNAITTLPIWLRLRIGLWTGYMSDRIYGDYSLDGIAWTNVYSARIDTSLGSYGTMGIGLFIENYLSGGAQAIAAPFEYFRMYRVWGP